MYVRIYVGIHICMHALVGCCDAKRRYHRVDPDRFIDVSCFADGLQCRSVSYRLSSVAVHLGKAPDRGHCQTLFCDQSSSESALAGDGVPAVPIAADRTQALSRDTYLLLYQLC